ncbi:unnamed protein product [Boreogadus saida]
MAIHGKASESSLAAVSQSSLTAGVRVQPHYSRSQVQSHSTAGVRQGVLSPVSSLQGVLSLSLTQGVRVQSAQQRVRVQSPAGSQSVQSHSRES